MNDFEVHPVGTKKIIDGLCPHKKHETACCLDCGLEAEIYQPNLKQKFEEAIGNQIDHLPDIAKDDRVQIPPSARQVGGDHYKTMAIQPHYFCHVNKLGALESNVIKYICRHHQKEGLVDLEKAEHYIALLKQWQYGERAAKEKIE